MANWADKYIAAHNGPMAIVRTCTVPGCRFKLVTRKPGRPGRGWGFREGNKQRGEMIQHIKAEHPDLSPSAATAATHSTED